MGLDSIPSFTTKTDKVDLVEAAHMNGVQTQIVNIADELGAVVRGSAADLKTRLAVMMNDDGTVKSGSSFPVSPSAYQPFYRSDQDKYYIRDAANSQWLEIGSARDYDSAANYVEATASTEQSAAGGGSYAKLKEFTPVIRGGDIRVAWQGKRNSGGTSYMKVYVNGSPVGVEKSTSSDTYVNFSDDITVVSDDIVQIYGYNNNSGGGISVQNAELRTSNPTVPKEVQ